MKTKHIAIVASTAALAFAIQADLETRFKGATFEHVTKIGDRTEGSDIASLGLPGFIPGNQGATVYAYGVKMDAAGTTESRRHQWQVVRDPEATTEEVIAELGSFQEYKILAGNAVKDLKLALSEVRLAVAESDDDAAKLAAYKEGFALVMAALS